MLFNVYQLSLLAQTLDANTPVRIIKHLESPEPSTDFVF